MATSLADLVVNVSANVASLQQGMAAAAESVQKFGNDTKRSLDDVNSKLTAVGDAFKTVAAVFGVSLSVGFFKDLVTGSVESQAHLVDLGLRAGVTAEQISALAPAARTSGTSLDEVAIASGKFSKTLVDIAAGTGKGVQVFQQLGLSAQDAARFLKDPAAGLQEVSARLATFADDGAKAAAAQLLLGRSGAALLPFLHDLAEQGAEQAAVSNEQAAAAHVLQQQLALLGLQTENLKNSIIGATVPAMIALANIFIDAGNESDSLKTSLKDLVASGAVQTWAYETGKSIAHLYDLFQDAPRLIRPYIDVLGQVARTYADVAFAAEALTVIQSGNFTLGMQIAKAALADFRAGLANLDKDFEAAKAPLQTTNVEAFQRAYAKVQIQLNDVATAAANARPHLTNLGATLDASAASAGRAADAYDKALTALAIAQADAANSVGQAQIKAALEDLSRAYQGALVDFRSYYDQRSSLQIQALQSETVSLQLAYQEQTTLQANFTQQALTLTRQVGETQAQYASRYYDLITKATQAEAQATKTKAQLAVVQVQLNQVGKDYVDELIKQSDGLLQSNRALDEAVVKQERQNEEIGLTRSAIIALNIARVEELRNNTNLLELTPQLQDFYDKQIDGLRRLGEATAKGEGIQRVVDAFRELDSAAQGIFERIGEKGQDVFKQIGASIKKFVLDLIYQLTVKPILINLVASVTGVGGGALGGATTPGGLLGLLTQGGGGLSSLVGGGGGLGGLASSFATSGVGAGLGLSTTLVGSAGAEFGAGAAAEVGAAAAGAAGTALTAAGSALVAAIPVVGWAIAAAAAIYSIIQSNKKPSPVEGQFGFTAPSIPGSAFEDNAFTSSRFGNIGFLDQGTRQFSGEAGQVLNKQIGGLLDLFAARESDAQVAQTATNLQATQFPHFSGTFTTEDFLAKYGDQILKQVATTAFDVLDPALGKVIAGFTGTGQALTTFIGNLIVFHDLAAKLPADVAANLAKAIGSTEEGLDKVNAFAVAFVNIQGVFNANPLDDALESIKAQSRSAADAFGAQGDALQKLIDQFTAGTASATDLANATQAYYNAEVALIAQIEQVKTSITAMFGDTIRSLTLQTLDNAGKGNFLNTEIGQLQNQLFASTDPAQIQALANRINQDISQLFGLLSPAEQQSQLSTFTDNIRALNDEVTARLQDVESGAESTASGLLTQIQTALTDVAQQMADSATVQQDAAAAQQQAAQQQQDAANTPIRVEPVIVFVPTSGETNG